MDCEIKLNNNGDYQVKTNPSLYKDILEYVDNNAENAINLYGVTLTDEFKNSISGEVTLDKLLSYVQYQNSFDAKALNKVDYASLKDFTLSKKYIADITEPFVNSFTVDGLFGINYDTLESQGLFSENDIQFIMNLEDTSYLKQLYDKMLNNQEAIENVVTSYNISKPNSLNKINPDEFLGNIYDNYIDARSQDDVAEIANNIQDEVVMNNPELADTILDQVRNKQEFVSYETDEYDGALVKKMTNDTLVKLEQTLDLNQDFSPLMEDVEVVSNLRIESLLEDRGLADILLRNLEDRAAFFGIDISGFTDKINEKSFDDFSEFIDSFYNFVYDLYTGAEDVQSLNESMLNFSNNYNYYFDVVDNFKNKVADSIEDEGVFMNIETNRSEEELFNTSSVIRYNGNIYQKIKDNKTLDELYTLLENNSELLPTNIEDIDSYVTSEAKEMLNENSDLDTLKKIVSYKLLIGVLDNASTINSVDTSYLQKDIIDPNNFLVEFNKELLKNERLKDIFYFSNRGLESKVILGDYTMRDIQNELSEKMYSDLQQYALLSQNSSIDNLIPQFEAIETDDMNIMRNFYANNMKALKEESSPYKVVGDSIIAENIVSPFIKVKGQLYEQLQPNVYQKVQGVNDRYRNYNIEKPYLTLDNVENYIENVEKEYKNKIKTIEVNDSEIEFC